MKRTEDRELASGWTSRKDMKMIVRKEQSKTFYKYLKLIYDILAAETSGYALYIHEGRLYFTTYAMGGKLSISCSGVEVYDELCKEPGAYEIRMTPHKDFEISRLPESKVTEDMKNIFKHATIGLEEMNHLCEINSNCSSVIADIARKSKLRIKDRYLKVMKKLQDFDVSMNKDFIICTKAEAVDKENLQVVLIMYFWCEDIQDEYDQDKLGMD